MAQTFAPVLGQGSLLTAGLGQGLCCLDDPKVVSLPYSSCPYRHLSLGDAGF